MNSIFHSTSEKKPEQSIHFALFFFAFYGYIGVFSPYASLYFSSKGLNPTQIGILMSMMQIMRIFGPNLWGWVADYTNKRATVLRIISIGAFISVFGIFWGNTFVYFFLFMLIFNFFTSAQGPLSEALILSKLKGDFSYYGKIRLWGSVGFIFTVILSGQILDYLGIDFLPWITIFLLALVLIVTLKIKEESELLKVNSKISLLKILKKREVITFFASTFFMIAAHSSVYVYFSLYLSDIGYSKSMIGIMWSFAVIAEIIFFFYQSTIFKKFGISNLMLLSFFVGIIRFLLIGFGAEHLILLFISQILHFASFGAHHSASIATIQVWFSGPLQARGQALYISISYGLGGTFGGLLMSACWDIYGPKFVYIIASVFCFFGFISSYFCYKWLNKSEKNYENI